MGSKEVLASGRMTLHQYQYLHLWVVSQLGKPEQCENCGSTEEPRYEWANLSGDYIKDISDWARLCNYCHKIIDGHAKPRNIFNEYCVNGHKMVITNLYKRPRKIISNKYSVLSVECRQCRLAGMRKFKAKAKAQTKSTPEGKS